MPTSTNGSDDEVDESREPTMWREVEDTINDEEDPMEDVFLTTLIGGEGTEHKPLVMQEEFNKNKFIDPLGILRMPPRTFTGKPQSIDDEHYDPVGQLAGLHISTNFSELVQGMRRLNRKLSSQEADIKQLVRDNFDRFISCKDVIDGIYDRISENESSASGNSTRQAELTMKEVLARAKRVYEPLLNRKAETDQIRQSLSVLTRFSFLFTLPSKIATNIRDGEYDKAVQHYKKAASIFQDQAAISHVSVFMHVFAEVENIVAGFRTTLYTALADPSSSFEAQERVIRILVDLARPEDFRINGTTAEKDTKDDPGWYYLNMAATRMSTRLSSSPSSIPSASSTTSFSLSSSDPSESPKLLSMNANTTNASVYKSVRSVCGHVARHLPNLWKMGQYYLMGKFDPRNYNADDKGKEEMQAHPTQEKEKLDKATTVRVFFSDETTTVRVDSRRPCGDLVETCLRRVEGDHSADNYAIFTWIEKRKKDGTKVIKITELGPGEKIKKLHKKWGDKSGVSHRFLFKRKNEKFPKTHDPRTVVEDYTLEMRSTQEAAKKKPGSKAGKKTDADFHALITSILDVFAERVEAMFFIDNSEDDFDADLANTAEEFTDEWAFGKMRAQVLDVVTTFNILQRAGMTEKYLNPITLLTHRLSGHYVTRVCGQWATEVALLYLSVSSSSSSSSSSNNIILDSSLGLPLVKEHRSEGANNDNNLITVFEETTKFYLDQFKGIISKGHPLVSQVQTAFGESLKSFADTLHHLAFIAPHDDDDDLDEDGEPDVFKASTNVHRQLRIAAYILETRNIVIGNLWSHFHEMFKLVPTFQVEEEVLTSPLEVFHHLGNMTIARYIHDRLNSFNRIIRNGLVVAPTRDWSSLSIPTGVSEFAMSVLLHFVYAVSELAMLETKSKSKPPKVSKNDRNERHYRRESRSVFDRSDRQGLLDGTSEEVIGKMMGTMVWGVLEGVRLSLAHLDRSSFSIGAILQLRLDFIFIETVLSRHITEEATGISRSIHDMLAQMEEEAYQNGAGEDQLEVDLQSIIEDTTRRSVVLFASLTGDAENPAAPQLSNLPSLNRTSPGGGSRSRKPTSPIGAELKYTKESKLGEVLRKRTGTNGLNKETSNSGFFSLKKDDNRSPPTTTPKLNDKTGVRSPPLPDASVSLSNRERLKEREKAKLKERESEREKEKEKEREKEKEKEDRNVRKPIEKDGASNGEMTSRDLDREKLRQREREKRKAR